MKFLTTHGTRRVALMAACFFPLVSVYAQDGKPVSCDAAMEGTFKITEQRGARGVSKPDDDERIKISRNGRNYAFSFVGADGKALPGDEGQSNVGALTAIEPDALWRMVAGNDKDAIAEAKKNGLVLCGLKGKDGYFVRSSDKEQTSFTANFGSGFGAVVLTLEPVK